MSKRHKAKQHAASSKPDAVPTTLAEFAASKGITAAPGELFTLPVDEIFVEPGFNVREDSERLEAHISGLEEAYAAGKFVPPLTITMENGRPKLADGHNRIQAFKRVLEAGNVSDGVQVNEYAHGDVPDTLILTANSGLELTPLEESNILNRLSNKGYTEKELAAVAKVTIPTLRNRLALHVLPMSLKEMIRDDLVKPTTALQVYREHGSKAVDIIKQALVDQTEGSTDGDDEKKPVKKKVTSTAIKSSSTGLSRISNADNQFFQRSIHELAIGLLSDNDRVKAVKSKNRIDVSFTPEDFLLLSDMMSRIVRYDEKYMAEHDNQAPELMDRVSKE